MSLDESLAPGQPGHIDAHEQIAEMLNAVSGTYAAVAALGFTTPLDFGAVPVTTASDAVFAAGSATVTSASGAFTSAMDGQLFYARGAGVAQEPGSRAWENAPLYGTVTYVSPGVLTLSVPAVSAVTGDIHIGPDATGAINAALAAGGKCLLPAGGLIVAGQIAATGDAQKLIGAGRALSHLLSVTARANGPIFAMYDDVVAEGYSWWGTASGDQPANISPTTPAEVIAGLADSGCGTTFAAVRRGTMRSLRSYHCGGTGVGAGNNGIAGLYATMGCQDSYFEDLEAWWCRNGWNEDSFFATADPATYSPRRNTYHGIRGYYCRFGVAWETGNDSRNLVATNLLAVGCSQTGIELHTIVGMTIFGARGENCGLYGVNLYGHHSALAPAGSAIYGAYAYGNGVHGIRVGDFAHDCQIIGGESARNAGSGLAFSNGARHNTVRNVHLRLNAQGGAAAEVLFNNSSNNTIHVLMDRTAAGWAHTYAIGEQNSSGANVVEDGSVLVAGSLGLYGFLAGAPTAPTDLLPGHSFSTLTGSTARRDRARLAAMGLKGETFSRYHCNGSVPVTSGDTRAVLVGLAAGDQITGIYAAMTVASATVTLAKMGVWDSAGTLLASSGNLSANFVTGTGIRGGSLSAPWVSPVDGSYYIGILTVTSAGAGPGLLRASSSGVAGFPAAPFNGGVPEAISGSAATDLGALSVAAGSSTAPWLCWT